MAYNKNPGTSQAETIETEVIKQQYDKLQREHEELKSKFEAIQVDVNAKLSGKKIKKFITSEQFAARRICPDNIEAKLKESGFPPDVQAAILEKAR
jgi:hypothetical protein